MVQYEWDDDKAEANLLKHAVSFDMVHEFDWASALEAEDLRYDYGETRMQAVGLIGDRVHVLVYTRRGSVVRVISLRKANRRELR